MSKTQTESFCKRHCQAPELIFFNCGLNRDFAFLIKSLVEDLAFFLNILATFSHSLGLTALLLLGKAALIKVI